MSSLSVELYSEGSWLCYWSPTSAGRERGREGGREGERERERERERVSDNGMWLHGSLD